MNYDEFLERLASDLKKTLEPSYGDLQIEPLDIEKVGRPSYRGLCIGPSGEKVAMSADFSQLFSQMEQGRSYTSILNEVISSVSKQFDKMPAFDVNRFMDYDAVKEHLVVELVGVERNKDQLLDIPHETMEDMALIYRCEVGRTDTETMSFVITNRLLDEYGITAQQLHEDALRSAQEQKPLSLQPLFSVLMGMSPAGMLPPFDGPQLYVASTKDQENGAAVMAYPGFFDQAAECVGKQFFILPSSRHEVLLLEDDGSRMVSDLKEMVSFINATEVKPEDVLTDNVYHYDSIERVFETADSFEARTHEQPGKFSVLQNLRENQQRLSDRPTLGRPSAQQEAVL